MWSPQQPLRGGSLGLGWEWGVGTAMELADQAEGRMWETGHLQRTGRGQEGCGLYVVCVWPRRGT